MKLMRLCFFLLQFSFAYFVQKARSQGASDGCIMGFICMRKRLCPSMIHMEKILNVKPKACGRDLVCCPKLDYEKTSGLEGRYESATDNPYNVPDGKYPWMASILHYDDSYDYGGWIYKCTGFLVDRRHVITSARCFKESEDSEKFYAHIGKYDYRKGRPYNITRILKHEGHKNHNFFYHFNDIALLSLSEEVDSPDFNPIRLPTVGDTEEHRGRVLGWHTGYLQEQDVPIVSEAECETMASEIFRQGEEEDPPTKEDFGGGGSTNQVLCIVTSTGGIDGPLMVKIGERWTAVGLANGVLGWNYDEDTGTPLLYTRISAYVDWIKKNI